MTVRIEALHGEVKVLRHFGVLMVEPQPTSKAVVGEISGIGVVGTPMGLVAGYTRQRWAVIGPECRVVVWVDGAFPIDPITRRALIDAAGVCLADEGRSAERVPQEGNSHRFNGKGLQ